MNRHLLILLEIAITVIILAAGRAGNAQPNNVGPGERRFNAGIYKASHNSYERGEALDEQLDFYNVWCVEFDLNWDDDDGTGQEGISVEHFCRSGHDAQPLAYELAEVARTQTGFFRVTVIYLEIKDDNSPCYRTWPAHAVYREFIRGRLAASLGLDRIYPAAEFKTRDQFAWPSYQELVRRGYNYIVILDENATGLADSDFFFGVTEVNPPASVPANTVLVNINAGYDDGGRGEWPIVSDTRWLHRAYPSDPDAGVGGSCHYQNGDYWADAVAKQFNFIATNCVEDDHTFDPLTHSPDPLWVRPDGATRNRGTLNEPFTDLLAGLDRASPAVNVLILSGYYDVPDGLQISKPLVLHAVGGPVTIR